MAKKRVKYVCKKCGSDDVRRDSFVAWDVEKQEWVFDAIFDYAHCCGCDGECRLKEVSL